MFVAEEPGNAEIGAVGGGRRFGTLERIEGVLVRFVEYVVQSVRVWAQ